MCLKPNMAVCLEVISKALIRRPRLLGFAFSRDNGSLGSDLAERC